MWHEFYSFFLTLHLFLAIKTTSENAVSNIRTTFLDEGDVELSWDPPISSKDVDHYKISVILGNSVLTSLETDNTSYTFTDLEPCCLYNFIFGATSTSKKTKFKDVKHAVKTLSQGKIC